MKRLMITVGVALALTSACAKGTNAGPASPPTTARPLHGRAIASLVSSDSCGDLLGWIKAQATGQVTAYGLGPSQGGVRPMDGTTRQATEDKTAANGAPAPSTLGGTDGTTGTGTGTGTSTDTGTNNQVAGVDEGDMVKLAGDRALVLHGSTLSVVSLSPILTTVGTVAVPDGASQLLVVGSRAYVLSSGYPNSNPGSGTGNGNGNGGRPTRKSTEQPINQPAGPATTITEVAVADQPVVTSSTTVDGSVVASRLADGTVRIVTTTQAPANLGFLTPDRPAAESIALEANKRIIAESKIEDWLPSRYAADGHRELLVSCSAVFHPVAFSGFGALSVLSITDGLASMTTTSVIADGETTYASATSLYVATTRWHGNGTGTGNGTGNGNGTDKNPRVTEPTTEIHRFDISVAGPAVYQGSGQVPGTVINQYALDEAGGVLRIATTRQPIVMGGPTPISSCPPIAECMEPNISSSIAPIGGARASRVTTLRPQGDQLVEVGHLDGLGPTETIQGVRYVADLAYVVTFRNTDPLFVIDLSDPAAPKLLGQLTSPGFSNYLHPVAPGRLLGVGVDGTEFGGNGGAKVSLYDTSDPTSPQEIGTWRSNNTSLNVGSDPHAFTFDPATGIAVIVGGWSDSDGSQYRSGAIVLKVDERRITELGRIARSPTAPGDPNSDYRNGGEPISRTFMHAGSILAVSDSQISSHDTATAAQTAITQL